MLVLRLKMVDRSVQDEDALKQLGAKDMVKFGNKNLWSIIDLRTGILAGELSALLDLFY